MAGHEALVVSDLVVARTHLDGAAVVASTDVASEDATTAEADHELTVSQFNAVTARHDGVLAVPVLTVIQPELQAGADSLAERERYGDPDARERAVAHFQTARALTTAADEVRSALRAFS